MTQNKNSFRHESLQDAKSIQEILKSISKGLGKGQLSFKDEEDEIIMKPEGLLSLKVTANQDDSLHRVNIRISWQSDDKKKPKKNLSVNTDSNK